MWLFNQCVGYKRLFIWYFELLQNWSSYQYVRFKIYIMFLLDCSLIKDILSYDNLREYNKNL